MSESSTSPARRILRVEERLERTLRRTIGQARIIKELCAIGDDTRHFRREIYRPQEPNVAVDGRRCTTPIRHHAEAYACHTLGIDSVIIVG